MAYRHCQQRGLQRVPGYEWRLTDTADKAMRRRIEAIRGDPAQMAEVRALADWLLGLR